MLGMKTTNLFFWSLATILSITSVHASDCTGSDCDIEPMVFEEFEWIEAEKKPATIIYATPMQDAEIPVVQDVPTWLDSDPVAAETPELEIAPQPEVMVEAKLLTIKPVPEDNRPPLWDGVIGEYDGTDATQTVDWKDGVPIWDESIASYKYKDFSDWFLKPTPEIYLREVSAEEDLIKSPKDLYLSTMEDAAATRARVEELLAPQKPAGNLWFENTNTTEQQITLTKPEPKYVAQDMTEIINKTFSEKTAPVAVIDDGCPFDSVTECEIWRRKPIVHETVSPRSSKLRNANIAEFLDVAHCNIDIKATHPAATPLLDRYKMLMRAANACCTDGMAYKLKQAGASDGLVYKFLVDDANFYGIGARCLMMTDYDLDSKYPNTATSVVAADVRNGCLCRGRQWFKAMLAPYQQVYQAMPEFKNAPFRYTYKDGLQREITVSINNDVQNVLKQLEQCP
ncbi:MAG: hypothetical protein IJE79_05770 [Alphaproteobacteria bacterium]|nr:hypothetical protein [Alphaproteobacteria bacterium]